MPTRAEVALGKVREENPLAILGTSARDRTYGAVPFRAHALARDDALARTMGSTFGHRTACLAMDCYLRYPRRRASELRHFTAARPRSFPRLRLPVPTRDVFGLFLLWERA